jgi:hypothetical protein
MLLGLSLAACSQGFVDEGSENREDLSEVDGGLAKSILISMGAIDDPNPVAAPKFQPRPTLVVPAQRDLPPPVDQDAALAAKGFPVDPEVRDAKERAERRKSTVTANNGNPMSVADQKKFNDLPTTGPGNQLPTTPAAQRASELPLKPWELDGKAQAAALEKAQVTTGPAAKERNLLTPPTDYRTPSDKAPLESPATGINSLMSKPSWWPF